MRIMTTRTELAALLLFVTAAAPAQELSWAGLPAVASTAPAALASQLQADAAKARTGGLGRSFQPRLGAGASANAHSWDSSAGTWPSAANSSAWDELQAGLDWNLWRGGRDRASGLAADAEASAAALEARVSQADILLGLREAFLDAQLSTKRLEINAEAVAQAQEDRAKAEKKAGAGLTSRTDVDEFDLRLLALQQERASLEDDYDAQLAALASLAGVTGAKLGSGPDAWPEQAPLPDRPGLEEKLEAAHAQAETLRADAEGRWPWPALGVGLGMVQGGENGGFLEQQDYRAGAALTLSLWDGGEGRSARQALESSAKAFEALGQAVRAQRQAEAELAVKRIGRWLALRESLEKRVASAEAFRKAVAKEYLRGVRDGRDLEETTKTYQEARTDLESARAATWRAWSAVQRLAAGE